MLKARYMNMMNVNYKDGIMCTVYSMSLVVTFPWAGETELYILHFLQQFQDESLGLVPP